MKALLKNLRAVGDRVLIKFVNFVVEEKTSGGIILPESAKEQKIAVIIGLGEKVPKSDVNWKVGDKVIFNDFDCKKLLDTDGIEYGLVKYDNVWAVFE